MSTSYRFIGTTDDVLAKGQCPGCRRYFRGERGLRAHQHQRYSAAACRPMAEPTNPEFTTSR